MHAVHGPGELRGLRRKLAAAPTVVGLLVARHASLLHYPGLAAASRHQRRPTMAPARSPPAAAPDVLLRRRRRYVSLQRHHADLLHQHLHQPLRHQHRRLLGRRRSSRREPPLEPSPHVSTYRTIDQCIHVYLHIPEAGRGVKRRHASTTSCPREKKKAASLCLDSNLANIYCLPS